MCNTPCVLPSCLIPSVEPVELVKEATMSRALQQITIFVSSTSEVDAEKAGLRLIVVELNKRLEKSHAVTLRVIGWPEDIRPGVNTDSQAEISRQIGNFYDIYLGLLGPRFGTPTPRAGSGTEEEFEDALKRFRDDSRSVRVLFYFKKNRWKIHS